MAEFTDIPVLDLAPLTEGRDTTDLARAFARAYGETGFGYVVTALLALTSNDYSVRRLGPAKWKQLHTAGVSILMLYFLVAFSGRLLTNFAPIYAVYVALIATAVVAKLRVKRRTMTAATD